MAIEGAAVMHSWLPDLVELAVSGGDWDLYLQVIHSVFRRDFVDRSRPDFRGRRLGLKKHPVVNGLEATFWHLISEGKGEDDRNPDLRRCERIGWPRPIIEAVDQLRGLRCWATSRRGERRWVLALEDFSYIVVLADRGEYLLPWTAYPIEYAHERRKLSQQHQSWIASQKS